MYLINLCFILLFSTAPAVQAQPAGKPAGNSFSEDTILYLKKRSEVLLGEKKYEEVYHIFSYLANYYSSRSNQYRYFDYQNKAQNCLSKFSNPSLSLDTWLEFFKSFRNSPVMDPLLCESIISTFINNYPDLEVLPLKLIYLDSIIDPTAFDMTNSNRVLLLKHRIEITGRLSMVYEQLKSYYRLLNLDLTNNDKIKYQFELGSYYSTLKENQLSNITLFSILCDDRIMDLDKSAVFNLLGNNFLDLKKYNLASYFYRNSLLLRQSANENSDYLRTIYNNIASYYTLTSKIDSARIFYETSLQISKEKFGENSYQYAFELNNIGNHYYQLNSFDSAFIFYKNSLDIKLAIEGYQDTDIIHSYYNVALVQSKLGDIQSAIQFLHKSILMNFDLAMTYSLSNGIASPEDYIFSCKCLGDIYLTQYEKNNELSFLDSAKRYYQKAIKINDSIIFSTPIESSKFSNNLSNVKIIENLIGCYLTEKNNGGFLISDTIQLLSLFDKCHNYVLHNKLAESEKGILNPFGLAEYDNNSSLDKDFNDIEQLEDDRSSNLSEMFRLSKILFDKIKNTKFYETRYTNLNNWNNFEPNNINYARSIEDNTLILEYTIVKDNLLCLSMTNNKVTVNKIGCTAELEKLIASCNNKLRQYSVDFNELYNLSGFLLSPVRNISSDIKKIVIIKDENLLTIPFDLLLLDKPCSDYRNNTYLIKEYDISYSYSINLLLRDFPLTDSIDNFDFVGFAPDIAEDNYQNSPEKLPNSDKEILHISSLFKAHKRNSLSLTGTEANFENFCNVAEKTGILHIAAHSTVNNSSNFGLLINSSENDNYKLIDYFDVLNLSSSPNLVVLASCSSNSGRVIEGEGIRNIGRAFSIKGTSFIISSLFRLDDRFSYSFMSDFYSKYLISGDVTKSLCAAKRECINSAIYSYPTYWSNFNLIGK